MTAKMNDIDPRAWMADVLARLPDLPVSRVHELLYRPSGNLLMLQGER